MWQGPSQTFVIPIRLPSCITQGAPVRQPHSNEYQSDNCSKVGSGLQLFSIFDASTPADKRQQAATTKRTKDKRSDHDDGDCNGETVRR
jgi:hypothetical protein